MNQDALSILETKLKVEKSEEKAKDIKFYIHYLKTIQKQNRKNWLLKRCQFVGMFKNSKNPVRIIYDNMVFNYPSYNHACFHILLKEIDKGNIKIQFL